MEEKFKWLLLKSIKDNSNISNIVRLGYTYAYIAQEYSKLINNGMVVIDGYMNFVLSDSGIEEFNRLNDIMKKINHIEPLVECRVEKINKFDVFIE